jgi:hypothetical protein
MKHHVLSAITTLLIIVPTVGAHQALGDNTNPNVSFRVEVGIGDEDYFPYLCNAGIKHPAYAVKVCHAISDSTGRYKRGEQVNYLDCENINSGISCECTSPAANSRIDYMRYTTSNEPNTPKHIIAGEDYKDGGTVFTMPAASGDNSAFSYYNGISNGSTNPINTLYFELGSELFGAEYFLDVCYPPVGPGTFTQDPACIEITSSGVGNGDSNSVTYCSRVTSLTPVNINPNIAPYQVASELTFQSTALTTSCSGATMSDAVALLNGTSIQTINLKWNQDKEAGCVIRYTFRETTPSTAPSTATSTAPSTATSTAPSTTVGDILPKERPWQLMPASFKISGKVPDPQLTTEVCTHTQGYWQNWSGCRIEKEKGVDTVVCGGSKYDLAWEKVTYLLQPGFPNAAESASLQQAISGAFGAQMYPTGNEPHALALFGKNLTWYGALTANASGGDSWTNIAHQWIATTLNLAAGAGFGLAGADATDIRNMWIHGAKYLFNNDTSVLNLNEINTKLDWFNNGGTGNAFHCND